MGEEFVAYLTEGGDMRHIDEIVIDLHYIGKTRADSCQSRSKILKRLLALCAEIAGHSDQFVLEIKA